MQIQDTIAALATAPGAGAIAVIRVSGEKALEITSSIFEAKSGKPLLEQASHTLHLGAIHDRNRIIDEVLVSLFRGSRSYTGEPTTEISCHGSPYIQQEILQLLFRKGCRAAKAGEFTLRAFINGKMDLSQAEAVADLIASDNAGAHQIAMQQMRGGFSQEIAQLRQELLNFASLIELELDFAEEDVEFADREDFQQLISKITRVLKRLIDSFATGNVIKNGIPVAIVGEPNVGKSTLLNALLNEERAIVSDIAGTTRDTIEDELAIGGIGFRFIDTAGIRETTDVIEGLGIKKTFEKIGQAQVVILLLTVKEFQVSGFRFQMEVDKIRNRFPQKPLILVVNKIDQITLQEQNDLQKDLKQIDKISYVLLSAKEKQGVDALKDQILKFVNTGALRHNETLVTNSRHYDALLKALEEIEKVQLGIDAGLSGDLLAIDIREALYHFGEITGQVTNDELLGNIFANFCIGK
ncbi:MAG: tRNA uridine-5-carboxymethylaminomethyl(34) synthesis GTPase MnmE [Leeuwenhoekiella sp.]